MSPYTFALGLEQTLRTDLEASQFHRSYRAIPKTFNRAIYPSIAVLSRSHRALYNRQLSLFYPRCASPSYRDTQDADIGRARL